MDDGDFDQLISISNVNELREAVRVAHQCDAQHIDSVPLIERMGNKTIWKGLVFAFSLEGHPEAKCCYAWTYNDGGQKRFLTVLEVPPVVSAHTALREAIASGQHK